MHATPFHVPHCCSNHCRKLTRLCCSSPFQIGNRVRISQSLFDHFHIYLDLYFSISNIYTYFQQLIGTLELGTTKVCNYSITLWSLKVTQMRIPSSFGLLEDLVAPPSALSFLKSVRTYGIIILSIISITLYIRPSPQNYNFKYI